jgi:hypothetical protein
MLAGGKWRGGNIAEFTDHYDSIFDNREFIRLLSKQQFRKHQLYIKDISRYYREIYKDMERLRGEGEQGRIDFDFYDGHFELNKIIEDIG